jgi:hypothetical protein
MLLSRAEMTFDFGPARLDCARDRALLGWVMNQFLYGEVTGIQCGHWLYEAPDLEAARFFARQALEEFQHVDNFVQILALLGERPAPVHPTVRFLTTGMMPGSFEEHVCLEMAQGEGLVLLALYALIDTLPAEGAPGTPEGSGAAIREILLRAVRQEERHVEFGERRTQELLPGGARPWLRARLLGLSLVSLWGVGRLGGFMRSRLPAGNPVLLQLPAFLAFARRCAELRLLRMGVLERPLAETGLLAKAWALCAAYPLSLCLSLLRLPLRLLPRGLDPTAHRRLTETYLGDKDLDARSRTGRGLQEPQQEG